MDTENKLGIKKSKAILLFARMLLIVIMLIVAIYLLFFAAKHNLGGWMISSYVLITISILAVVLFIAAIFVNILLPQRNAIQIGLLSILLALTFGFMLRQNGKKKCF